MEQRPIGDIIRQAREEKKLTQQALALRLGVTNKAVSKWERNRCRPDVALLGPLAEALELTVLELVTGERPAGEKDGVERLASYSAEESRRKVFQVNQKWLTAALCLVGIFAYALWMKGYSFSAEGAARSAVLVSGPADVALNQPMTGGALVCMDFGGEMVCVVPVERWGPLWRPMRFEAAGGAVPVHRDGPMESLGGITYGDAFGYLAFRCTDPAVRTVTVTLNQMGTNTVRQAVNTGEIQIIQWPAAMKDTLGRAPVAVACDEAGEVLYHLEIPVAKQGGSLRAYGNLYYWWPGPMGTFPGLEAELEKRGQA